MYDAILFGDTPENFYHRLEGFIKEAVHLEFTKQRNVDEDDFIKKPAVINLLSVSNPTVDSHVKKGYYKKYEIGSRILFNKQEILKFLRENSDKAK